MVTTRVSTSKPRSRREKLHLVLPALAGALSAYTLMTLSRISKPVERVHDSAFTGKMWFDELVNGTCPAPL